MAQLQLTQGQERVFKHIVDFLDDDTKDVFILRGYAGTGKTTLITYIGNYLHTNNRQFEVLAPTGRAAKVLQQKFALATERYGFDASLAGKGETIHRQIYSKKIQCLEVESKDVAIKSYKFYFPLIDKEEQNNMCNTLIVDESSMVGDTLVDNEFLIFGSGRLLHDLMEYKRLCNIKKIIFVGDDAQLPPVEDPESRALKTETFEEMGLGVESDELTEVLRQNEKSAILKNATAMRDLLKLPRSQRNTFNLETNDTDIFQVAENNIAQKYTEILPTPESGQNVLICFSNAQCFSANQTIREIYFPDRERLDFRGESIIKLQVGDVILNTKNSLGTWGIDLFNGDMSQVIEVGKTVSRTVPVRLKGDKNSRSVILSFTEIAAFIDGKGYKGLILDNFLYSKERSILVEEEHALYVDFCIRHQGMKEGSDEWKEALRSDPYFNALRAKFSYAITCHKSQGGEWKCAMVDYKGRIGLSDDAIRWCYTATTRARMELYAINPPRISAFDGLKFSSIGKIGKAPKKFYNENLNLDIAEIGSAPFGVGLKYKGILNALQSTDYTLENIEVLNYLLRFDFNCGQEKIHIETNFDGEGVLKRLPIKNDGSVRDELCKIINESLAIERSVIYEPNSEVRADLYQRMLSVCEDANVKITNIVEDPSGYAVSYHLKTDASFATIKFYNSQDGSLGTAMPQSELAEKDEKLQYIIQNI